MPPHCLKSKPCTQSYPLCGSGLALILVSLSHLYSHCRPLLWQPSLCRVSMCSSHSLLCFWSSSCKALSFWRAPLGRVWDEGHPLAVQVSQVNLEGHTVSCHSHWPSISLSKLIQISPFLVISVGSLFPLSDF